MKQALENATDEDREAVSEMLRDLNELLGKHRRGEDTDADFREFMAKHGHYFPENPQSVEELVDALAKRAAAAQRLLQSMSPEQREELMRLSAQAFGSAELMAQLNQLDASLRALRPGEDWSGSERFGGQEGLGLGDGTGVLQDIAELDELSEQLSQPTTDPRLDDLDLDALARQLGQNAAVTARTLAEIERAMQDGGYLRRGADGDLRLSPQAMRRLGKSLLRDTAKQLSGRQGRRDTRVAGAAGEQTGSSRQWEFGDAEPWDVTRTITNAIRRTMADGGDPGRGLRLAVGDIEVAETEARTQAAVVLLADVSFSMAAEGRWVPMKRTALALHHLVSTRFRGDRLQLITFGRYAQSMDIGELTALPALREQGTNLHHGLLLAGRFFRQHPSMQPVLLVVTDGEPTAHLLADGESWFCWPPDPETIRVTVAELDRLGRAGTQATFFRLGDDPGLERFVQRMARRIDGRVVAPDTGDLGAAVVGEYLRAHFRGRYLRRRLGRRISPALGFSSGGCQHRCGDREGYQFRRCDLRRQDAEPVVALQRIDLQRKVMGAGAAAEFLHGLGFHLGQGHIQFQCQPRDQRVGALHHVVQALDALDSHVTLGLDLGLGAVEVNADQHPQLLVH